MLTNIFLKTEAVIFDIGESNKLKPIHYWFDAPDFRFETAYIQNQDGAVLSGAYFGQRKGRIEFLAECSDFVDTFLRNHELRQIFLNKKEIQVFCDSEPNKTMFCYVENYEVTRPNDKCLLVSVDLIAPYPYFRSSATSTAAKSFDADAWQFGQNLQLDDMSYEHTAKSFAIYNASDITIDPRTHYLQATFVIKEAASFFRVTNRTTNEIVQINRAVAINDVVTLDGVNTYLNGQNIIADTNLELLTFAVGINEIELNTLAESAFDFYFYYI